MIFLSILLITKIVGTIAIASIPFLFYPQQKLEGMTQVSAANPGLFRLYGVAITALLIGYSFGLYDTLNGVFPYYAVVTGVFSNGGAALFLLKYAQKTALNTFVTAFFGVIAILLTVVLVLQI